LNFLRRRFFFSKIPCYSLLLPVSGGSWAAIAKGIAAYIIHRVNNHDNLLIYNAKTCLRVIRKLG
jgi:hypothetical protein